MLVRALTNRKKISCYSLNLFFNMAGVGCLREKKKTQTAKKILFPHGHIFKISYVFFENDLIKKRVCH